MRRPSARLWAICLVLGAFGCASANARPGPGGGEHRPERIGGFGFHPSGFHGGGFGMRHPPERFEPAYRPFHAAGPYRQSFRRPGFVHPGFEHPGLRPALVGGAIAGGALIGAELAWHHDHAWWHRPPELVVDDWRWRGEAGPGPDVWFAVPPVIYAPPPLALLPPPVVLGFGPRPPAPTPAPVLQGGLAVTLPPPILSPPPPDLLIASAPPPVLLRPRFAPLAIGVIAAGPLIVGLHHEYRYREAWHRDAWRGGAGQRENWHPPQWHEPGSGLGWRHGGGFVGRHFEARPAFGGRGFGGHGWGGRGHGRGWR